MKALLMSLGTRGDMEPFLAAGLLLKAEGWEVGCVMPEQFRELVTSIGLDFFPFTKDFLELIEGQDGKDVMGQKGSFFNQIRTTWRLYQRSKVINRDVVATQKRLIDQERPDRVIYHHKCLYPTRWGMDHPGRAIKISPIPCLTHAVDHHSAIGMGSGTDRGRFWNRVTYRLLLGVLSRIIRGYTKAHATPIKSSAIRQYLLEKEKTIYSISPTLFPRPDYWPASAQITGYAERPKTGNWEPDEALTAFLNRHPKVLFVTFGSMVNTDPEAKTQALLRVIIKHNIPAIINTSWGGLVEQQAVPDHVFYTNNVPYDALFPRIYAVVHHGGSGTTHTAIKYGCASLIIPHIMDQFFWNRLIAKQGAGPLGIPIKKLTENRIEPLLLDLWTEVSYKQNAQRMAESMAMENPDHNLIRALCS